MGCGHDSGSAKQGRGRPGGERDGAAARARDLAVRHIRAHPAHGGDRRHHAPHRVGPLDHAMEAGDRCAAAAQRRRLAGRVRCLQAQLAICADEPGHDACRLQAHLFLGISPSPARPADRCRVRAAVALVPGEARGARRLHGPAGRAVPAWRRARRDRLADGAQRAHRSRQCRAGHACRASRHGAHPDGGRAVDGGGHARRGAGQRGKRG